MMAKQEIVLQGLNCANCAQKIEAGVQKMPEIKSASLNLVKQILSIELGKEADSAQILAKIERIVHELEPEVKVFYKTAEKDVNEEFSMAHLYWRLGIGVFFWLAAFFLPDSLRNFSYLLSYLIIGSDVLLTAGRSIIRGQIFNEYFLMSIATIGAIAINEFNEGIAVMLFYQIGEGFQRKAVNHSRKSIAALLKLKPEKAHLKTEAGLLTVEPEKVKAGDIIVVKPGEKVPLDGVIVNGMSYVDTSALTGESVPRRVEAGSEVLSGFINTQGMLTVEVKREFSDSAMMKVLDLVQNAAGRKSPIENFITAFARYYTPVVVIAAFGLAFIPPLVLQADFTDWVYRALVFLVVSCPCALVLSIPLGFFGGIGGAAKQGILVKGGNYLDALNKVDTVVLDKTGTLTKGVFKVNKVYSADGFTDDEVLQYAASVESFSNHPIALSIVQACTAELKKEEVTDFRELAGYGVKAKYGTQYLLLGNENLLRREGISFTPCSDFGSVVYLAVGGKYAGAIVVADELKENSQEALNSLRQAGIKKLIMLTGDKKEVGERLGEVLRLDKVYCELLPEQKVAKLEEIMQGKKGKVAFVGDGINDAPVLARADIGLAMGGMGNDAAIEAADIVLMDDDIAKVSAALSIARRTKNIVWQNIIFAMGVKGIILLMGAGGVATIWEAVFADVGVALLAVINSLRAVKKVK